MDSKHTKIVSINTEVAYQALDMVRECFETRNTDTMYSSESLSLEQLYAASKALGITAMLAYALNKRGIRDNKFRTALAIAQRRALLLDAEYKKISNALEAQCICHLPLKGIVIKDLYPSVGLREMSDIDIWFDSSHAEDVKSIMSGLGYNAKYFGVSKHDVYLKPPMFCVEMHRIVIDTEVLSESAEYYDSQWDKLNRERKENEYVLAQSREDFYVYVIAHAYKHDLIAGVGVRVLLDVFVMLQKWKDLDIPYIVQECHKLGIADFESLVRRLSLHLFDRNALDQEDRDRLDQFVLSGVHGNMKRYYSNALDQSGSKRSYIRSRLKTTDDQLKDHPFLLRHKALRPLYFPLRLAKAVFNRPKLLSTELKTLVKYKKK